MTLTMTDVMMLAVNVPQTNRMTAVTTVRPDTIAGSDARIVPVMSIMIVNVKKDIQ
jgi:hypothetical protein